MYNKYKNILCAESEVFFMAISPVAAFGAVLGAIPSKTTSESLENTIAKLEKQRSEYKNRVDLANSDKITKDIDERINNLQNRLSKLKQREEKQDGECQTCKNRKYQDGSDDPGVSFKSATKISKGAAEAAVRSHEQEHVVREQAKAERTGREVVSQTVRIKYGICPECGDSYCAGGVTTTVTRAKPEQPDEIAKADENAKINGDSGNVSDSRDNAAKKALGQKFAVGIQNEKYEYGKLLNTVA